MQKAERPVCFQGEKVSSWQRSLIGGQKDKWKLAGGEREGRRERDRGVDEDIPGRRTNRPGEKAWTMSLSRGTA